MPNPKITSAFTRLKFAKFLEIFQCRSASIEYGFKMGLWEFLILVEEDWVVKGKKACHGVPK